MTRQERQVRLDEARRYLGDVQLNPDSTETDYWNAKTAVDRAEKALRGTPHTLLGITRKKGLMTHDRTLVDQFHGAHDPERDPDCAGTICETCDCCLHCAHPDCDCTDGRCGCGHGLSDNWDEGR